MYLRRSGAVEFYFLKMLIWGFRINSAIFFNLLFA